jgi:hypothetical protein
MSNAPVPSPEDQLQAELQSALLADDPAATRKLVEIRGKQVEVRAPTIAQEKLWQQIATGKDGKVDPFKVNVSRVIACTFVPGTDKPVFTKFHEESLMKSAAVDSGPFPRLVKEISKLISPDAEAIAKNSEGTPAA